MITFAEKNYKAIFIIIVIAQIGLITYLFEFKKQSFHSDELWSYGFAASSDGRDIYRTDGFDDYKNFFKWEDCGVLKDYIVVDESEVLDYKSVYKNCSSDLHAPLYFFVLHFVLAIFKGTWSKWYAFVINMLAFAFIQFFLHKMVMLITKDRFFALMCTTYFGFTMGAINMNVFLRTYSMGAALILGFVYFSTKLYYENEMGCMKKSLQAGVLMYLAVLTVNLNFLVAFSVTLLYCICYLVKKRIKLMLQYGFIMLGFALLAIASFPAVLRQISFAKGGSTIFAVGFPPAWQNKIYWAYLQHDIIGFRNSIWPELTGMYIMLGLLGALFLAVPIAIVFRNDGWFIELKSNVKNIVLTLIRKTKFFQYPILMLFIVVFSVLMVNAHITDISAMGEHSRRYIFVVYAVYACAIMTFAYYPIKWVASSAKTKYFLMALAMLTCLTKVICDRTEAFFFRYGTEGMQISDIEDDANIILSIDTAFLLVCATDKLMDKGHFLVTNSMSLVNNRDCEFLVPEIEIEKRPLYIGIELTALKYDDLGEIGANEKKDKNNEAYNLIREDKDDQRTKLYDVKKILLDEVNAKKLEYVGMDRLFGRRFALYKVLF